jgi:large subunit ribosomal protein L3
MKKNKIVFRKLGMTRLFDENNRVYPITVLQLEKTIFVDVKTKEKDGYEAAILSRGTKLRRHKTAPALGKDEKYGQELGALYETSIPFLLGDLSDEDRERLKNKGISLANFVNHECVNRLVDVTAITKGHGFTGVMKRHNFKGLRASHGVSACHRSGGSTGMRTEPSRTIKNQKMAGHYGVEQVTIKNLKVFGYDEAKQCLFIVGAVPGPNKSYVSVAPISLKMKKGGIAYKSKPQEGELYVAA